MIEAKIVPAGETAYLIRCYGSSNEARNRFVQALSLRIESEWPQAVLAAVPAYDSVLVEYDLRVADPHQLMMGLYKLCNQAAFDHEVIGKGVTLPVLYGGEVGFDLEGVARQTGFSCDDVVRIHTETEYRVYCVGFTPGFPYLGFLPPELEVERLKRPRLSVPAGSVGLAGRQTGLYPIGSPGGWRIIGRTPVSMIRPAQDPPVLLEPGDFVRFRSIERDEFECIQGEIEAGTYEVELFEPMQTMDAATSKKNAVSRSDHAS